MNQGLERLMKPQAKRSNPSGQPKKQGKARPVHTVGYYKGHLKDAQGLWNSLNHGKCKQSSSQGDRKLTYAINNPSAMDAEEILAAKNAGLEVHGQYCETKTKS